MHGYQVATRLRQEQGSQDAVIIAVTGYGQEDDRCHSPALSQKSGTSLGVPDAGGLFK